MEITGGPEVMTRKKEKHPFKFPRGKKSFTGLPHVFEGGC